MRERPRVRKRTNRTSRHVRFVVATGVKADNIYSQGVFPVCPRQTLGFGQVTV